MRRFQVGQIGRIETADGDPLPDERLDLRQRFDVLLAAETDRVARRARARRAADAMHVVLGILGQVVIDDVADVGNVQPARGDIGRDERRQLAVVELAQHPHALSLRHVAGHGRGRDAIRPQQALEALGQALGVDEDHRARRRALAHQVHEQRGLLLHRRVVDHLPHELRRDALGLDADQFRVVHVLVGELEHAMRERRRKQHVQAEFRVREAAQQEPDVLDEAEVEHAVGLVENQHLHVTQVKDVLPEEIDDAARRADQDVDARFQRAPLLVVVHAAEGKPEREARVLHEDLGVVVDLDRELPRRRENERARRRAGFSRRRRIAQQMGEEGDQECGRLARAGLRLPCDIEPRKRLGQRRGLDRRASLEARVGDSTGDGFRQMQGCEGKVRELLLCHRFTTLTLIT